MTTTLGGKQIDVYRAWSKDWTKSVTFYGTIINSKYWDRFKDKLTSLLGDEWGYELAITQKISTDINYSD